QQIAARDAGPAGMPFAADRQALPRVDARRHVDRHRGIGEDQAIAAARRAGIGDDRSLAVAGRTLAANADIEEPATLQHGTVTVAGATGLAPAPLGAAATLAFRADIGAADVE